MVGGDYFAAMGLGTPVADRFATQLAFVQHLSDASGAGLPAVIRFGAVRAATVRVVGSGGLARSAAVALVRNGVGAVELLALDEPDRHRAELTAEVAALHACGVESTTAVRPYTAADAAADSDSGARSGVGSGMGMGMGSGTGSGVGADDAEPPDVVVHCAMPGELATLFAATTGRFRAPIMPVVVGPGTAVLGPVPMRGRGPCWVCAQLRLAARGDRTAVAELGLALPVGPRRPAAALSPVAAEMLGSAVAFEVFRLLVGLPADGGDEAVVQDTETLESSRHRLLPHPRCPVCPSEWVGGGQLRRAATDEERYRRLSVLAGGRLTVFGGFTDGPLAQAPLKVGRIAVGSPSGAVGGRREITAFHGTSTLGARAEALGAAVLHYVGQLPDRDDAITGTTEQLVADGRTPVPLAALATASGTGADVLDWVPARSLCSGANVLVPLAAAYPMSPANAARLAEPAPVGAAVGQDADELVARGLTSALAHRAVGEVLRGRGELLPLNGPPKSWLVKGGLAEDDGVLLKALRQFGRAVTVYDLPGAAPAHAVLASTDSSDRPPLCALGHGLSRPAAVAMALRELLGQLQVLGDEGRLADLGDPLLLDLDPPSAPPAARAAGAVAAVRPAGGRAAGAAGPARSAAGTAEVLVALGAAGWDALLVDTTTPDVRAAEALVAGVVLLAAAASGQVPADGRARGAGT